VVLEAGLRNRADVWETADSPGGKADAVLPGVAAFTRVCAYDRPGTTLQADQKSRSDPVPMPRTAADAVADLHALLATAGEPGPYVLVGHSTGGLISRLYASTFPDDVAGLVLVDALPEGMQALLSPAYWERFNELNVAAPRGLESYRDLEIIDFAASFDQMRAAMAAHPLGAVPLVVLSRSKGFEGMPRDMPADFTSQLDRAWRTGQDQLAALRPDARHTIVPDSGHYIQVEQPDVVVGAVREVVEAARAAGR
jgi:pimeloyl-ACP methyl ester carboxylesterase